MAQLRQDYQEFIDKDTEIIVVGPENHNEFQKYWSEEDMPFIGIPDPEKNLIKLYRQQVKLWKLGRMPAQFIIDKKGKVIYSHYSNSMSDISENDDILEFIAPTS